MKKKIFWGIPFTAIILIVIILTWKGRVKREKDSLTYETAEVEIGDVVVSVSATGVVEPLVSVEVKSKASGEILQMPVELGDRVKKGDLIARLDQRDAKNDYDQARAELEVSEISLSQAERDYKRIKELFDKTLASDKELEDSKMAFERAKATLVKARVALSTAGERLKDTVVRSPISGVILVKNVELGQIISSGITSVSGGTLIVTVGDLSSVYVRTDVDETDIGKIKIGKDVRITPEAYPDITFDGKVERISSQAKVVQNVTTFEVTSKVSNSEEVLKSGMNANVEIISEEARDVLVIPVNAVKDFSELRMLVKKLGLSESNMKELRAERRLEGRNENKEFKGNPWETKKDGMKSVLVIKNGKIVPRFVKIGLRNWDKCEVKEGLTEGEEVVVISGETRTSRDRDQWRRRMQRMGGIPGLRRS